MFSLYRCVTTGSVCTNWDRFTLYRCDYRYVLYQMGQVQSVQVCLHVQSVEVGQVQSIKGGTTRSVFRGGTGSICTGVTTGSFCTRWDRSSLYRCDYRFILYQMGQVQSVQV